MRRTTIFNYLIPNSEDVYAACRNWKLSYDGCREAWETISAGVCNTYEASGYKLKNFMIPRFKFDAAVPRGWKRHPDGLYSPPQSVISIAFEGLPVPESFSQVCYDLGFPELGDSELQYWLLWTPKGRLVITIPNAEVLAKHGVVFDAPALQFFADNCVEISKARYDYWVAKDFLELANETPD